MAAMDSLLAPQSQAKQIWLLVTPADRGPKLNEVAPLVEVLVMGNHTTAVTRYLHGLLVHVILATSMIRYD